MIISQIESGTGGKVQNNADIMQWAIKWAADLITNYQVGEDGKTAFERIKCRRCRAPLAQFGERVMYMQMNDGKDDRPKIEKTLLNGIWLGIKGRTGEHIIGTEKGIVKAYTVKRRPEEERWSIKEFNGVRGTPGRPTPGLEGPKDPGER